MDLQLKNKVALVSGSTAGIGYAIAKALAAEGANPVINGRTQASVDDVISIYKQFLKGQRPETAMLGRTLEMIQKETIKSDYKYLNGYYHMYHYWKSGDNNDRGKVRRNLIQVYDLDEHNGLMNCRLMISPMKDEEKDAWWIMKDGWLILKPSFSGCLNV